MNDISGVIGVAHIIPSLTALQSKDHAGGVTNIVPVVIGGIPAVNGVVDFTPSLFGLQSTDHADRSTYIVRVVVRFIDVIPSL